ncbi:MAG: RluA family pseudouridine synthase [Calditrichia bacterium]
MAKGYKGRKREARLRPTQFSVVYQDEDLIVINKPAGLLAVPIPKSKAKNVRDLLNDLLKPQRQRAIIVHRIDRYTSGLMVFAKHRKAHGILVRQFLDHTPRRVYLTLVRGVPSPEKGELRHYLKLTTHGFRQVAVKDESEGGTLAVTRYQIRKAYGDEAALLEIELDTGLKNQIRVQLAEAGHPIVGDRHYVRAEKNARIDHQALHAWKLGFNHPADGKYVEFKADPPDDFRKVVAALRRESS